MYRLVNVVAAGLLALSLTLVPAFQAGQVWADDDDDGNSDESEEQQQAGNVDLVDARVAGTIFHVGVVVDTPAIVIVDNDSGLEVAIVARDPNMARLITNGTACRGRFVVADGNRIHPQVLEVQGMAIDTSKRCL